MLLHTIGSRNNSFIGELSTAPTNSAAAILKEQHDRHRYAATSSDSKVVNGGGMNPKSEYTVDYQNSSVSGGGGSSGGSNGGGIVSKAAIVGAVSGAVNASKSIASVMKAYGTAYFQPTSTSDTNSSSSYSNEKRTKIPPSQGSSTSKGNSRSNSPAKTTPNPSSTTPIQLSRNRIKTGSSELLDTHPLLLDLKDAILTPENLLSKNVDMLVAAERVCVLLGGCRITFCKSGKDRTGMAVTYEQSRQLGERFGCGVSNARVLRDSRVMRVNGVRILIAEKNIGRRVYSINSLQVS